MRNQINNTQIMDELIAGSGTAYTSSLRFSPCAGDACLFVSSSGDGSSLAISQQCSVDNVNWYLPMDTSKTQVGIVVPTQLITAGTYVSFDPIITKYIRFKVVEGGAVDTTVVIKLLYSEEV